MDRYNPVPGHASQRSDPTLACWMRLIARCRYLQHSALRVTQALVQAAVAEWAQAAARGEDAEPNSLWLAAEDLNQELKRLWRWPIRVSAAHWSRGGWRCDSLLALQSAATDLRSTGRNWSQACATAPACQEPLLQRPVPPQAAQREEQLAALAPPLAMFAKTAELLLMLGYPPILLTLKLPPEMEWAQEELRWAAQPAMSLIAAWAQRR